MQKLFIFVSLGAVFSLGGCAAMSSDTHLSAAQEQCLTKTEAGLRRSVAFQNGGAREQQAIMNGYHADTTKARQACVS